MAVPDPGMNLGTAEDLDARISQRVAGTLQVGPVVHKPISIKREKKITF